MSYIDPRNMKRKGGGSVLIRTAKPEDAQSLLDLGREVMAERDFTLTEPDELNFTAEQEAAWIRDHLDHPAKIILVAEVSETVVGIIDFANGSRRRNAHAGEFGMSVAKHWREKGIGRALLETLLAWAEANPKLEKVQLTVRATNIRAISLYRSLGFQEEGRRRRDLKLSPNEYVDSVLMGRFVK